MKAGRGSGQEILRGRTELTCSLEVAYLSDRSKICALRTRFGVCNKQETKFFSRRFRILARDSVIILLITKPSVQIIL